MSFLSLAVGKRRYLFMCEPTSAPGARLESSKGYVAGFLGTMDSRSLERSETMRVKRSLQRHVAPFFDKLVEVVPLKAVSPYDKREFLLQSLSVAVGFDGDLKTFKSLMKGHDPVVIAIASSLPIQVDSEQVFKCLRSCITGSMVSQPIFFKRLAVKSQLREKWNDVLPSFLGFNNAGRQNFLVNLVTMELADHTKSQLRRSCRQFGVGIPVEPMITLPKSQNRPTFLATAKYSSPLLPCETYWLEALQEEEPNEEEDEIEELSKNLEKRASLVPDDILPQNGAKRSLEDDHLEDDSPKRRRILE